MNLFGLIRSNDWWEYKIPPLLAIGYASALVAGTPIYKALPELLFLLAALLVGAVYVSIINDITDIEEDLLSGKANYMAKLPVTVRWAIPAICLLAGVIFMWAFKVDRLSIVLYLMSWIAFSLYSIPPVRLKQRAVFGLFADACGAHLFPCLLMASAIFYTSGTDLDLKWFMIVGIWALSYGLRGILWHQFADRRNDLLSGTNTYASKTEPAKLKKTEWILLCMESIVLICMLLYLLRSVPIATFVLCLYMILFRHRYYNVKLVAVLSPPEGNYHILLSDFYQFFLPVSLLISDAIYFPLSWAVMFIHLLIFPKTTKTIFRDLGGLFK